ncbi:acid phosphatase type 7-like [Pectinophora gossypiella]|uniref:acid phosphatase type 7-like n=1 Tax=Pectinophora gossypiella TaxID=13191 RepID=UPI00214F3B19|nr:acid phosphatase type 7-like [Pectinophora gossypiella]
MLWFTLLSIFVAGVQCTTLLDCIKHVSRSRPLYRASTSYLQLDWIRCIYCQPEQIHLSFGEKPNDMVVTWSTPWETTSVVHYGAGHLNNVANGDSWWFTDGGLRRRKQRMHRVVLEDLEFNTTYLYNVGSEYGWSERFSFTTPPAGQDWVVSAAIYGDLGNENAKSLPYIQIETQDDLYDFVLHVGDFAYDLHSKNAHVGDQFMRQIQPIAAYVPYMTCPGNHEAAYNFSNYKNRFSMPGDTDGLYYSWNLGPLHLIAFSTELYYDRSNGWFERLKQQWRWIQQDLIEATKPENRETRPWIIMYGHRPMYCSSTKNECDLPDVPQRAGQGLPEPGYGLEPMLKKFGVDLVIFGHEHSYERSLPMYDHKVYNSSGDDPYVNPLAPVHLITGSAGCREHTYKIDKNKPWIAFSSSDYGYTKFKTHNKTHLHFEQVSVDKQGKVIDSFWLVREKHVAYQLP